MLLLIIKTFQEQRNGIHFAYNDGVEIKWGGRIFWKIRKVGGGGHNKMKWGSKFSKNCKVTPPPPPPTIKHNRVLC